MVKALIQAAYQYIHIRCDKGKDQYYHYYGRSQLKAIFSGTFLGSKSF